MGRAKRAAGKQLRVAHLSRGSASVVFFILMPDRIKSVAGIVCFSKSNASAWLHLANEGVCQSALAARRTLKPDAQI